MARISLLFTLALVLAIGSVSAHPFSHKKTKKTLCPSTLGELQAFPSIEISKLIEKTAKSAPKTITFQTLFAVCKAYNDHLVAFKAHGVKGVVDTVHIKYAVMTKAMLKAQGFIGVDGELGLKLRKTYGAMAEGYVQVVGKVGAISAKYKFNADAKISQSDRADIEKCVIKLRGSIRAFLKVVSECDKKLSGKVSGFSSGPVDILGAFTKQGLGHANKLIGFGGHGQVGAGAKALAHAGAKLGAHAGAKLGAHAGAKLGAHAGAKLGAHAGAKVGGHGKVHGGAKAGGLFGGVLGFGGKAKFHAAGKANVVGGNRSGQ